MIARELAGRVALVTGSTSGIGRAFAETLGERGASLIAHGLHVAEVDAIADDWRGRGFVATGIAADLGARGSGAALAAAATEWLDRVDILILNASVEIPQLLGDVTDDAVAIQLQINLTSNIALLRALVPPMRRRGWGRVVSIGSVQEERPNAQHLVYAGTKAALTCLMLDLAKNEAVEGVTFNIVRPGAILTDRNRDRLSDPAYRDAVLARIPSGRIGEPSDCAQTVGLLCSEGGAYINGSVIAIDGGLRL